MTTPTIADSIYVEPLNPAYVEEIIRKERPDALLSTMGGQTALNLSLELDSLGILKKYDVEIIGASAESINKAEDRGEFKKIIESLGLESPRSKVAHSMDDALEMVDEVGYPLVIRPSFTLGGMGGAIAQDRDSLEKILEKAFLESPTHEALIEESLIGWKEFEMEVMRDKRDNAIIVCSIENIDPMGVHTGDSITIAPTQTLSDREYQVMRKASIDILRAIGVDCGGSNVQFAVNPSDGRMIVIEMNPRVSRSSALASKATGFPIARCSAKLAVGYTLDEVINEITGVTASCFEPALDYCAVKVPRFEMEKFPTGYTALGTQMKSVGESLAMGRTAIEAINKAIRAAETGFDGLTELNNYSPDELKNILSTAHPHRFLAAFTILKREGEEILEELAEQTGFDIWFLHTLLEQVRFEKKLRRAELNDTLYLEAKEMGLSDGRIGEISGFSTAEITELYRSKHAPCYHLVDTCAGEFQASTPYFYSSWGEVDEGVPLGEKEKAVIIVASGPNRIGQGLEFDTCCTLASLMYRKHGYKTIMVNSNPETVSTDFNISSRLYLEPLTAEHVIDVMRKEKVYDVVVQLGGQTPLNMVKKLEEAGARVVGTSVENIDMTEDRRLFSDAVSRLGLLQPKNRSASTEKEVREFAREIGFPVLLRPSFVLGGRSMFIAYENRELDEFLSRGIAISKERPVLVDQFLEDAFEYDLDAVCDGKNVYVGGIMQHIEAAGIHSGDSACVYPPYKSKPVLEEEMKQAAVKMAREFQVKGLMNIQFALKDDRLYIIEVNPRGSRTVPFISKSTGVNLIDAAVRVWLGEDLVSQGLVKEEEGVGMGSCLTGWSVKEAVFSFDRFAGLDPILGPEMKSTGEAIGTGESFGEAFAKVEAAVGTKLPTQGRVFVSVNKKDRDTILPVVRAFQDLDFQICATRGTADFLFGKGIFSEVILKVHEGHPNVMDHMRSNRMDLLINTPMGQFSQIDDSYLRAEAVRRKIPYTTTTSSAAAAVEAIKYLRRGETAVKALPAGNYEL